MKNNTNENTSIFGSFKTQDDINHSYGMLMKSLPKKSRGAVTIFIGRLEETLKQWKGNRNE